ncbi:MAG: transglycosylase domain-containing protein [Actinomycetota bacterium]|nr:transglycosylase domain-containing protein [Actinomycetota bacterium]
MRQITVLFRLAIVLALTGIVVGIVAVLSGPQIKEVATSGEWSHSPVALASTGTRSLIYDQNGELMATFFDENRSPILLDLIPVEVREAILAIEDANFYGHQGVDLKATARALIENVDAGGISQGGSTITQQLIKNLVLTPEQTVERKMQEAALAVRLEDQLTKDEIYEIYLNTVFFGSTAYGIKAAAEVYFGLDLANKTPDEIKTTLDEGLGWPEAALLASLISNPSVNDPTVNPQIATYQRRIVLERLAELGYFTQTEAEEYALAPLPTQRFQPSLPSADDFFVAEVRRSLLEDPTFLGGGIESRLEDLLGINGGIRVYTTFDPATQQMALDARDEVLRDKWGVDPFFTVSIASLDPDSGAVRAMIGGESFDSESQFNLATQGRRQPGSSFKTIVLVAALQRGIQTDDKVNGEGPCEFPEETEPDGVYEANNFANDDGEIAEVRDLLLASSNCGFLKLGQLTGLNNVIDTAKALGIKSEMLPVISLPLGVEEVSPMEMANSYATLATGGLRREPYFIERIERLVDEEWVSIYEHEDDDRYLPERVITETVSCWATEILWENVRGGTGVRAGWPMGAQPAAGKTGTTENFEDAWFVGYTPYLATAVWMGNPDEKIAMRGIYPYGNVTGGSFPAEVWGAFNSKYHAELPTRAFPYCRSFSQEGEYLRTADDPEAGTNPCPDQIALDYYGDEEIDACEDELPEEFIECEYEYDYLDIDAVRVTVYCGDPPEEEEEEDPAEGDLEDENQGEEESTEENESEENQDEGNE